jgi:hypothetical protein
MPKGKPRVTGLTVDRKLDGGQPTYWTRQLERGEFGAQKVSKGRARVAVGDTRLARTTAIARRDGSATTAVSRNTGKKGKGRK